MLSPGAGDRHSEALGPWSLTPALRIDTGCQQQLRTMCLADTLIKCCVPLKCEIMDHNTLGALTLTPALPLTSHPTSTSFNYSSHSFLHCNKCWNTCLQDLMTSEHGKLTNDNQTTVTMASAEVG